MQIDAFDIDLFLRNHWQKRPALIRNPWNAWVNPLAPEELAGLACEDDAESRLIEQAGDSWTLAHGPFAASRFAKLGRQPWTLLVQAVDHHVPDVAALIDPFRFIPNWRIDDVMVSYATDGGGVGPHFDQYDVFLLQGLGRRRWRVGPRCDESTPLRPHDDLRLLAEFDATDEWVLEPGDILYVPPGFAHDGVAVGDDCMTYSIGFRAPSRSELIADWCDHVVERMQEDDRYADPDLQAQDNPGEISSSALDRLHGMIAERMLDRDAFARWFGEYNSIRKYPDIDWQPDEAIDRTDLRDLLTAQTPLCRNPASRFSFIRQGGQAVLLFVDGQSFECAGETALLAEALCAGERVHPTPDLTHSPAALNLLAALVDQGSLAFEQED
ncbi:cupin domain-containing protein [Sphingobium estronivorans]|uniref:cupin domain-containing protein n=1 Tax=Sphingobium estronivorans TaxID=1577690 RepID=UPI0012387C7D|nr:cupin domain-containing protein [Sphingobium estronivorans]